METGTTGAESKKGSLFNVEKSNLFTSTTTGTSMPGYSEYFSVDNDLDSENNSEIAREYGLSESMVRRWRKDQAKLFNGELKMSAKRTTMGRFTPKFPELDQQILEWFTEQREQGE